MSSTRRSVVPHFSVALGSARASPPFPLYARIRPPKLDFLGPINSVSRVVSTDVLLSDAYSKLIVWVEPFGNAVKSNEVGNEPTFEHLWMTNKPGTVQRSSECVVPYQGPEIIRRRGADNEEVGKSVGRKD